jgi:hypothetical protein
VIDMMTVLVVVVAAAEVVRVIGIVRNVVFW